MIKVLFLCLLYVLTISQLTTPNNVSEIAALFQKERQALVDELRDELTKEAYRIQNLLSASMINLHNKKVNEFEERLKKSRKDQTVVSLSDVPAQQILTLLTQRSCYDWKIMGFNTSGYYLIDPDGNRIGEPPFSVFCDMTTGYTFLHHDREGNQNVTSCSGYACYSEYITYEATKNQIEALIGLSDSCQQYIKINCLETPLFDGKEALAWWNDRHGKMHTYWSGDNLEGCSCSLTKSCLNPRTRCHCDAGLAGQWLQDSGYLSNSTTLPVFTLRFGTKRRKRLQMEYELGPLRCYGRKPISYPNSCEDIWISGTYASGYYTVGESPDNTRQVYCNMSQIFDKNYLATDVTGYIFFSASLTETFSTIGTIVFRNVSVNIGYAYNPNYGIFTAPYNGLYEFNFHGYGRTPTWVILIKNNLNVGATQIRSKEWGTISSVFMLNLKIGDKVRVDLGEGTLHGATKHGYWTNFSGKLVKRME